MTPMQANLGPNQVKKVVRSTLTGVCSSQVAPVYVQLWLLPSLVTTNCRLRRMLLHRQRLKVKCKVFILHINISLEYNHNHTAGYTFALFRFTVPIVISALAPSIASQSRHHAFNHNHSRCTSVFSSNNDLTLDLRPRP